MKSGTNSLLDSGIFPKQLALFLALLLGITLVSAGDKPWKSKPYQTWDEKDVQLIMTESPWVQITTIERNWLPVAEKDVPPEQQIAGGVQHVPDARGGVGGAGANPAAAGRESETSERQLQVYVYWDSSRVMREASARNAVLHGQMKDSEVEKYASAPQDEYQLVLHMADMTPFITHDEQFFADKAYIEMRRGKLKLPPSHVTYGRDNGRLKDVIFFFPKKTSSGDLTISASETDITFNCKIANSTLRVGFKPRQMADQSGPDL